MPTLILTSLLGKIRGGANDDEMSSAALNDICDGELSSADGFRDVDDIWTLFFLSIGLRGGKAGGISWLVRCPVGSTKWLFCLCDNTDFLDEKSVFGEDR